MLNVCLIKILSVVVKWKEALHKKTFKYFKIYLLIWHFLNKATPDLVFFDGGKKERKKVPVIVQKLLITLQPFHHLSKSQTILRQVGKQAFRISHEPI